MGITIGLLGGVVGALLGGPPGSIIGFGIGLMVPSSKIESEVGQTIPCPHCGARVGIDGPGFFRCKECQNNFLHQIELKGFDETGPISPYVFGVFAIAGQIAKADGRVSEMEIETAQSMMDQRLVLGPPGKEASIRAFNLGASGGTRFDQCCKQILDVGDRMETVGALKFFVEMSRADGEVLPSERHIIYEVADHLGITRKWVDDVVGDPTGSDTRGKATAAGVPVSEDAYRVLGLQVGASSQEVRAAYRKLSKEFHPDHLGPKGLSEELLTYAVKRFKEVQVAHDVISSKHEN